MMTNINDAEATKVHQLRLPLQASRMASNTSTQHIQDVLIILRLLYSKIFENFHL